MTQVRMTEWLSEIDIATYLLVMGFAITSWVGAAAVLMEIPALMFQLPEGSQLPTYILVFFHAGKISAVVALLVKLSIPKSIKEWPVIYGIMLVSSTGCMILAGLWKYTTIWESTEHSTVLLVITLLVSFTCNLSMVSFVPYMSRFKPQYISAFFVGEGLGFLIPSSLSSIQGVSGIINCSDRNISSNKKEFPMNLTLVSEAYTLLFTPSNYFVCIFIIICVSALCFTVVHVSPHCKKEYIVVPSDSLIEVAVPKQDEESHIFDEESSEYSTDEDNSQTDSEEESVETESDQEEPPSIQPESRSCQILLHTFLLFMVFLSNCLQFGVIISILPYNVLPQGIHILLTLVNMGALLHPVTGFVSLFITSKSIFILGMVGLLALASCSLHVVLANRSLDTVLSGSLDGTLLVTLTYYILVICCVYIRVSTCVMIQATRRHSGLVWYGFVSLLGQTFGGIVTHILITELQHPKLQPPCYLHEDLIP